MLNNIVRQAQIDWAAAKCGKCVRAVHILNSDGTGRYVYEWQCSRGHIWEAPWDRIKKGTWCTKCFSASNGETITRIIFEELFGEKFKSIRPDFLENNSGRNLELDGYCEKLKLAFEYNGAQHYESVCFSGHWSDIDKQRENDNFKKEICKKNGIYLIEIKYIYKKPTDILEEIIRQMNDYYFDICADKYYSITSDFDDNIYKMLMDIDTNKRDDTISFAEKLRGKGIILLSPAYIGRKHTYDVECIREKHKYSASGDTLLDNRDRGCPYCAINAPKNTVDIRNFAADRGFIMLGEYSGKSSELINFICLLGHNFGMSWDNIKQYKCPSCCFGISAEKARKQTYMLKYIEHKNWKYISGIYKNKSSMYRIDDGKSIQDISADMLLRKK